MYTLKEIVSEKTLRNIYFALVHPYIIYSIVAWGLVESGTMTQLNKAQLRILKDMKKMMEENDNTYKYWNTLLIKNQTKLSIILEKYNEYHGEIKYYYNCCM
jgi:hypothetical protein